MNRKPPFGSAPGIGRGKPDPAMFQSGVTQGSVLGPILFLIYVDDAARASDCEVAMVAKDMKILSVIRGPVNEDRLQMNLNRLEEWSNRWLLQFNVAKCSILRLSKTARSASTRGYFLGGVALQEVKAQKDIGVLTTSSLKPSAHCSRVAKTAMSLLSCALFSRVVVSLICESELFAPKARARLPTLPVKLLKRRKQVNKDVIKQQRKRSTEIRKRAQKQKQLFHRPAFFISRARKSARDESRLIRSTKKKPPVEVPNRERLGIVIRICGDLGLALESSQILHLLRLTSKNQAVFVRVSQAMLELLATVQPYVVWGYADLATTRNLILKRGKTKVGGTTKSLTNALVEEKLGQFGLLCIEDVIHELTSLGPHLREVLGFLHPFRIMPPTGDWTGVIKKTHHPSNQRSGNRSEFISQLVNKMV
nr:unnamed protein product [Spirometra erinaceieuropaei]